MGKYRYCFSEKGVLLYGWQKVKGKYYYADTKGHLLKGLQTIDGETYYFGTSTGGDEDRQCQNRRDKILF